MQMRDMPEQNKTFNSRAIILWVLSAKSVGPRFYVCYSGGVLPSDRRCPSARDRVSQIAPAAPFGAVWGGQLSSTLEPLPPLIMAASSIMMIVCLCCAEKMQTDSWCISSLAAPLIFKFILHDSVFNSPQLFPSSSSRPGTTTFSSAVSF